MSVSGRIDQLDVPVCTKGGMYFFSERCLYVGYEVKVKFVAVERSRLSTMPCITVVNRIYMAYPYCGNTPTYRG